MGYVNITRNDTAKFYRTHKDIIAVNKHKLKSGFIIQWKCDRLVKYFTHLNDLE